MSFSRWKFSQASKKELDDFLIAVKNCESTTIPNKSLWQQLLPQVTSHSNNVDKSDDVILIDDDIEVQSSKNETLDKTVINLTIVEPNETLDTNLNDMAEYLKESLEEDNLIENETLSKISKDYNEANIKELFKILNATISEHGLHSLGKSICNYTDISHNINVVVQEYCKNVLIAHLIGDKSTRIFENLLMEFTKKYSDVTRDELLLPLMKIECKLLKSNQNLLKGLQEYDKQCLLRDFLYSINKLEVWQLNSVQSLLNARIEGCIKCRLIALLSALCEDLKTDHLYIKLVISVIQNLGKGFEDQEIVLYNIIDKNETLLKESAYKALKEWSDNNI